jgi:hypothetical protein
MVSVFTSSAIDHGFEPWSGKTKDYKIGICFYTAKHTALRSKSKDWLARIQNQFFPLVLVAILKMAEILVDLSLCQILCLYHYPFRGYKH